MSDPLFLYPLSAWSAYCNVFRKAKQSSPELAHLTLMPTEAEPGCQRLIAFESPPFIAEYALVRTPVDQFETEVALQILLWYVGLRDEPRVTTYSGWLSKMLGREVVEIG